MDVDSEYAKLNHRFAGIHKALLYEGHETEASTELDGILWAMAQEVVVLRILGESSQHYKEVAAQRTPYPQSGLKPTGTGG